MKYHLRFDLIILDVTKVLFKKSNHNQTDCKAIYEYTIKGKEITQHYETKAGQFSAISQ